MNREKMEAIRDNIANVPESAFSMGFLVAPPMVQERRSEYWRAVEGNTYLELGIKDGEAPCGTVMCIAGRTCAVYAPGTEIQKSCRVAQDILGLTHQEADHLFLTDFNIDTLADNAPTKGQALAVIDTFLKTGRISWTDAGAWDGFDLNEDGEPYED